MDDGKASNLDIKGRRSKNYVNFSKAERLMKL